MGSFTISYVFRLPVGGTRTFDITLDERTLDLLTQIPPDPPKWTALDFHQCPHCPMAPGDQARCPAAVSLIDVVNACSSLPSTEEVSVEVVTTLRTVYRDTSAQRAVSAIMGLLMATSGCPHTAFFRPMARFHLPLADTVETIYRAASMYLLAQYFLVKRGCKADFELEGLRRIYDNVEIVNEAMARRLRAAISEDATVNGLIRLDVFAKTVPMAIDDALGMMEHLFVRYFTVT